MSGADGPIASFRASAPEDGDPYDLCFQLTISDGRADPVSCETVVHVVPRDVCEADDVCDCPERFWPEDNTCGQLPSEGEGEGSACDNPPCGICTPGELVDCTCRAGGLAGTARCQPDGLDYYECICASGEGEGEGSITPASGCCSVATGRTSPSLSFALLLLGLGVLRPRRRR